MNQTALLSLYDQAVASGEIQYDAQQVIALKALQYVLNEGSKSTTSWNPWATPSSVRGVYLYGEAGRGKTYLMDLFYGQLRAKKKMRIHFYRFMKMVHDQLKTLEGKKDPLKTLAKSIASQADVICFDEFFVENIVDAMLLGGLFEVLYDKGVTFVMTSNIKPSDLYKGGLQRERFLPAIHLIEKNNEVINVDNHIDYRLEHFDYDRAYYYPEDPEMKDILLSRFKMLETQPIQFNQTIHIEDRDIDTMYLGEKTAWFDFSKLCGIPRSQLDYIAMVARFSRVFISGLRHIDKIENDLITNFIRLVDIFYDAGIVLIISSKVPMEAIYTGGRHAFEFQRCKSRLVEMQTKEYLELR
jgi:cell division protein ZapE